MNRKTRRTLDAIFADPVKANIRWADIESLLVALDCRMTEGSGSRIRLQLNGVRAVFHRPHPEPVTDKGAIKSMRRFLITAGATPDKLA